MVVIYTGSNEIDKILEAEIKGSMVVSYEDFIIEDDNCLLYTSPSPRDCS